MEIFQNKINCLKKENTNKIIWFINYFIHEIIKGIKVQKQF